MKKRVLALTILCAMVISLMAGCNSGTGNTPTGNPESTQSAEANAPEQTSGGSDKTIKIGYSVNTLASEFKAAVSDGAEAAAKARGWEISILQADDDVSVQSSQCENLITSGIDCLVISPYDNSSYAAVSEAAQQAGIPVVTACAELTTWQSAWVGANYTYMGEYQAQQILEKYKDQVSKAVYIEGNLAISDHTDQVSGARAVLEAAGIETVADDTGNCFTDDAMQLTENWISSGLDFDLVVCFNDASALGAIAALKDAGIRDNVIVVGFEGMSDGCWSIYNGELDMSVYLPGSLYGEVAIQVAEQILSGKEFEYENLLQPEVITKDNVTEYMERLGIDVPG